MVNELTISFKDGAMTGVQVRGADGVARGTQAGDIAVQLAGVNEAALMCVDELASAKAEYAAFKARATTGAVQARTIIADTSITDADTCARIDALVDDMLKNKDERELEAAELDEAKDASALAASSARVAALRAL